MTDRAPRTFLGVKPKQVVIIAGLVGVLGFLMLGQDDGAGDQPSEADAASAESISARPSTNPKPSAGEPQTWIPNWPEVELEQMLAHDPFAPLMKPAEKVSTPADPSQSAEQALAIGEESDPAADRAAQKDSFAAFQGRGVSMIFRNQQKVCALIGDRVVQEGDVIDGMRVVAITATEVIVEPAGKRSE